MVIQCYTVAGLRGMLVNRSSLHGHRSVTVALCGGLWHSKTWKHKSHDHAADDHHHHHHHHHHDHHDHYPNHDIPQNCWCWKNMSLCFPSFLLGRLKGAVLQLGFLGEGERRAVAVSHGHGVVSYIFPSMVILKLQWKNNRAKECDSWFPWAGRVECV